MPEFPQQASQNDQVAQKLNKMADGFAHPLRAPILQDPGDYGLRFSEVTFPASDGVPIEAWFVPREGSDKLVIMNHPLNFNRYGCPTDREPFLSLGSWAGNYMETSFVEDYRILHDAGYNVLTYDSRDMGRSGTFNGLTSSGRFQARDTLGALSYVRARDDLRDMAVSLFSRCNGANATLFAMAEHPGAFADIRCQVLCQPLSVHAIMGRTLESLGLSDRMAKLEEACRFRVGFRFSELTPIPWAAKAVLPTFIYQVRHDRMTYEADVQAIFDAIPTEKKLHWIEGTTSRWEGYMEFKRRPQPMLDWLDRFTS